MGGLRLNEDDYLQVFLLHRPQMKRGVLLPSLGEFAARAADDAYTVQNALPAADLSSSQTPPG